MNLFALSGLAIFVSSLTFGIFSWIKGKRFLNKIWAIFNLFVAVWGFGSFKFSTTLDKEAVFFWLYFGHIGVILIPVLFMHFVFELLEIKRKRALILSYLAGGVFLTLNITDWLGITKLFIVNLRFVFNSFFVDSPPGFFYPAFVLFFFCTVVYGHICGVKYLKISRGQKRTQIRYFLLATSLGFAGGGTAFPMVFGIDIYPFLHFTIALYPLIMTYAIIKYRLMDIRIAIARVVIFSIVYVPILLIPIFSGYFFRDYLRIHVGEFWWVVPCMAMAVFATGGLSVYLRIQKKAEEILRAKKLKYFRAISEFMEDMKYARTMKDLSDVIVEKVSGLLGAGYGYAGFYLLNRQGDKYVLRKNKVPEHLTWKIKTIARVIDTGSVLIKTIKGTGRPVIKDELRFGIEGDDSISAEEVKTELARVNGQLVLPSYHREDLLAVTVLGEEKKGLDENPEEKTNAYDEEEIKLLNTLCLNIGMAIKNALVIEELDAIQTELMAAEKYSGIGKLATSAQHELNNPLSFIRGALDMIRMAMEEKEDGYRKLKKRLKDIREGRVPQARGVKDGEVLGGGSYKVDTQLFDEALDILEGKGKEEKVFNERIGKYLDRLEEEKHRCKGIRGVLTDGKEKEEIEEVEVMLETWINLMVKIMENDEYIKSESIRGIEGADRVKGIVHAMYELPSKTEEDRQPVALEHVVDKAISLTKMQTYYEDMGGTTIKRDIPDSVGVVRGYPNRLIDVVSNLVINAYESMTEAGIKDPAEREIRIKAERYEKDGKLMELRVANKGPLIPEGKLDKIFDQGYTTKESNTRNAKKGVGLHICKILIETFHDGQIYARNIEGYGPEFVIRLPKWEWDKGE